MSRATGWMIAGLLILLLGAEPAVACPNCKSAVAENSDSLALGFAWSIGVMLAAPGLIVLGWIIGLLRLYRAAGADPPANRLRRPLPAE